MTTVLIVDHSGFRRTARTLLASTRANRVKIAVSDGRPCHHVELEVGTPGALRSFHGPFAAAASRLTDETRRPEASLLTDTR